MRVHRVLVFVALVVLGGCLLDTTPLEQRACDVDKDCAFGELCARGYCDKIPAPDHNNEGDASTEVGEDGGLGGDSDVADGDPCEACEAPNAELVSCDPRCLYACEEGWRDANYDLDDEVTDGCEARTYVALGASSFATCAIDSEGAMDCWGARGLTSPPSSVYTQVDGGDVSMCALRVDKTLFCWGVGQDPDRVEDVEYDFDQAVPPVGAFIDVSAGLFHTCGVTEDGEMRCWGLGVVEGYGNEERGGSYDTDQALPPSGDFVQVAAGYLHSCGIHEDGTLACWGYGNSRTSDEGGRDANQAVPPPGTFTDITVGYYHSCALRNDRKVICWGLGSEPDNEELPGEGVDYDQASPPSGTFIDVVAGAMHTCAIRDGGEVVCWGIGVDPNTDESVHPTLRLDHDQATPPEGTFVELAASFWHTCALREDGAVRCWGWDDEGQASPPQ